MTSEDFRVRMEKVMPCLGQRVEMNSSPDFRREPDVVVGGGAGGLELVTRMSRRANSRLVLVDRSLGHVWKPRLHEIATAMQNQATAESSFLGHSLHHGYRFELGALQAIDPAAHRISLAELAGPDGGQLLPERQISYRRLVLALGSEENDFGTPGVRERCLFLNTPDQAMEIRARLLAAAFRLARAQQDSLSIVIIGGGATGVELAAEIGGALDALWVHEPALERARVKITVVEASDRLLNANPKEVSEYATDTLKRRGIALALSERVASVDAQGVELASGRRIEAELVVWAAGIRGPALLERMPDLPLSRSGRVQVDATLQCEGVPGVYAFGDCAEWTDPESGRAAPFTAQVAAAQATYLARMFRRIDAGREARPFSFRSAGAFVSLGDGFAAGNLTTRFGRHSRDRFIQGLSARLVYAALYRHHELTVHGWRAAGARWLVDRISRVYEPALKLH